MLVVSAEVRRNDMPGLFDRLRDLVLGHTPENEPTAPALVVEVKCAECGETIKTRIEKAHALQEVYDVSADEEQEPEVVGYELSKEMLGENCQQLLVLRVHFDKCKRMVEHEVQGGELVGVHDSE
jgi:hypothetical protein